MAKQIIVTGRKVLVTIGGLLLIGLVALILPDCTKYRVLVVNGSTSEIEDITLSILGRVVWSGELRTRQGRRIIVPEGREHVFLLKGQYARSGAWFEGVSDYMTGYSQYIHLFLIKDDGVYTGEWYDPPRVPWEERTVVDRVRDIGALFLNIMSCADHALWTLIRSSPKY